MRTKSRLGILLGGLAAATLLTAAPASAHIPDQGPVRHPYTETLGSPLPLEIHCNAANIRTTYGPTQTINHSRIRGVAHRGDAFDAYKERVYDGLITWYYGKVTRSNGRVTWGWVTSSCDLTYR